MKKGWLKEKIKKEEWNESRKEEKDEEKPFYTAIQPKRK